MINAKLPACMMFVLAISCSNLPDVERVSSGEQFVTGMYFEPSYAEKLCSYRVHIGESSREELYDKIDKVLPELTTDSDYFVTRLAYGSDSWIEISSLTFCEDSSSNESLLRQFSEKYEKVDDFRILSLNEFREAIGGSGFDLEAPGYAEKYCVVKLPKRIDLEFEEIYSLRYRRAIPIVYLQGSDSGSLILFENNCSSSGQYVSDILEFGQ